MWFFEQQAADQGYRRVAGIDEAGRGPLAGPVVAAAVILPAAFDATGINDSKKLSPAQRDRLYQRIYLGAAAIGIGIVDAPEIDRLNILQASLTAMAIAVENLHPRPDYLLIDGPHRLAGIRHQKAIPKGDGLSASIAAASIVAKVSRDRIMCAYHDYYPQFGFARHKGYPTKAHRQAIQNHGCCPIHRRSFRGVLEYT